MKSTIPRATSRFKRIKIESVDINDFNQSGELLHLRQSLWNPTILSKCRTGLKLIIVVCLVRTMERL